MEKILRASCGSPLFQRGTVDWNFMDDWILLSAMKHPVLFLAVVGSLFSNLGFGDLPALDQRYVHGKFCVEWTTTGKHAVGWSADADANGRPDMIDSVIFDLEGAWKVLSDSFRLPVPTLDASSNCSLKISIYDLSSTESEHSDALGLALIPLEGPVSMRLDNNMDSSRSAETMSASPIPGGRLRSVVYHESMHWFSSGQIRTNTAGLQPSEQIAQWFSNTRSGYVDNHLTTDTGSHVYRSLLDPAFRYSMWYWLEDIESRQGTSAVLDWIAFRMDAASKLPSDSSKFREDSLVLAWFRHRGMDIDEWARDFNNELGLFLAGQPSATMPQASSIFSGTDARTTLATSLDVSGATTRIFSLPSLTWIAFYQPRNWIGLAGQELSIRSLRPPAENPVFVHVLAYDSVQKSYRRESLRLGSDPAPLSKGNTDWSRFVTVFAGSAGGEFEISSRMTGPACRLHPTRLVVDDTARPVLDDGDLATRMNYRDNAKILLDLGSVVPLVGFDALWSGMAIGFGYNTLELSSDQTTWTPITIDLFNSLGSNWYTTFSETPARWVRFKAAKAFGDEMKLQEIAVWRSGSSCAQAIGVKPVALSRPEGFLRPVPGGLELRTQRVGRLDWISLDGRVVGTETYAAGTWRIRAPHGTRARLALWTAGPDRWTAKLQPLD